MSASRLLLRSAAAAAALVAATAALTASAPPAAAHPLDEYLQSAYVTVSTQSVEVELDLSPGVLVAPAVLALLDPDQDEQVSEAEGRAYAEAVVGALSLSVDGEEQPLELVAVDVPPYLNLQTGYGTLVVTAAAPAPVAAGEHEVLLRNEHRPVKSTYQVNAFVAAGATVVLEDQERDDAQVQSLITYRVDPSVTASGERAQEVEEGADRLLGYLDGPTTTGVVLLGLGAAALLGALHALTPGHAKTLMAAYLVGSGGTSRDAVRLAAVVTFTHTASVIALGLLAALASRFLVPGLLVPLLEVVAGLLVLVLGVRLLAQRRAAARRGAAAGRPHEHALVPQRGSGASLLGPDTEDRVPHVHTHGGRAHVHEVPEAVTARGLVALGVSGGLVPCPEALGVMVLAVGLGKTALGLGLVVAFSAGLAAVLIGLGLLLVHCRSLVVRADRLDPRWSSALPVVSAVVVAVLGAALLAKGLLAL